MTKQDRIFKNTNFKSKLHSWAGPGSACFDTGSERWQSNKSDDDEMISEIIMMKCTLLTLVQMKSLIAVQWLQPKSRTWVRSNEADSWSDRWWCDKWWISWGHGWWTVSEHTRANWSSARLCFKQEQEQQNMIIKNCHYESNKK